MNSRYFRISLLIFTAALMGCQYSGVERQNIEQVYALFEAFNQHDSDTLASLYSEDARLVSPEACQPTVGRLAIAASYRELFQQIPDLQDDLTQLIADGDRVAVGFDARGTINDQRFELPIAAFLTLRDGLIVEDIAYFDADKTPECSYGDQTASDS